MHDKDPSLWVILWNSLDHSIPEPIRAACLGAIVAGLRVFYDDKEPSFVRRLLESALCGFIAFGVASGIQALGGAAGLATFCGGAVGLFGADQVRAWGKTFAQHRFNLGRKSTKP